VGLVARRSVFRTNHRLARAEVGIFNNEIQH
jgi:hypothetical protein